MTENRAMPKKPTANAIIAFVNCIRMDSTEVSATLDYITILRQ